MGHGRVPGPRLCGALETGLAHRRPRPLPRRLEHRARRQHAEVHLQALARPQVLGLIEPEYIEAGDRKILCSGLWGVARHFNYLGEGFFSLSIALVFGYFTNLWAWTYFIFIVGLFISRQRLDDKFCEEKYGSEKWAEYQARVKYRIIPGVY